MYTRVATLAGTSLSGVANCPASGNSSAEALRGTDHKWAKSVTYFMDGPYELVAAGGRNEAGFGNPSPSQAGSPPTAGRVFVNISM